MTGFYKFLQLAVLTFFIIFIQGCTDSEQVKKHPAPPGNRKTITNSFGMTFVQIPAGKFIMGEATRKECSTCNGSLDETPRHEVTITRSFYMQRYEVTQKQWMALMDSNPSRIKGDYHPVEFVSWYNVKLFILAINSKDKKHKYRLPTEAEWEYAARGGTETAYSHGDAIDLLKHHAWYVINAGGRTRPVGTRKPNPWGLYDMHGNVSEWCEDFYQYDFYSKGQPQDPQGPALGLKRIRRGGSWASSAKVCTSSDRDAMIPKNRSGATGFRLVMER